MGIVLLGYRGSGKTTIGRRLAGRLNVSFVDTDDLIVTAAGRTIREIFEQHGEARFRALEATAVREICGSADKVIALGGGAVLREDNRRLLIASAHHRVYLRSEPEELVQRILADPQTAANRPSLTGLGGGIEEVRMLLAAREPLYREVMTVELDVTGLSVERAVAAILNTVP
jgi:shikimate kinase